jgi:site-specific DNA-methyltransferase (adenine-specific)
VINIEDIKLMNGDCLKLMSEIIDKSIDLIFTDLPYGTTNCKWDSLIDLDKLWQQYNRIIKDNGAIVLFAQTPFDKVLGASNLRMLKYEWIWEKTTATGHLNAKKMPMKAHENLLVFYKKPPTYNPQKTTGHSPTHAYTKYLETQNKGEIYNKATKEIVGGGDTERYPRSVLLFPSDKQREHLHTSQKPLALCEYIIKTYTNENDVVLDSCMGSGTVGVGCKNLHRQFIGVELDKQIFEVAENRIAKA